MTAKRVPNMLALWRHDARLYVVPLVLFVLVVTTALSIIYVAHVNRVLTIERDQLSQARDQLDIEWRHLLIEQNALTEHSRVERIAMEQLNMVRPQPQQEVLVPWR